MANQRSLWPSHRLRKNCTLDSYFETQSQIITNRYKEKNYPDQVIEADKSKATKLSQATCLLPSIAERKTKPNPTQVFNTILLLNKTILTRHHQNPKHTLGYT